MARPEPETLRVTITRSTSTPVCHLLVRRPTSALTDALGAGFRVTWPVAPNTTATDGAVTVAWLAPGEWAVLGLAPDEARRRAEAALEGALHLVADISAGRARFTVEGPGARDLLAKGCSLDLHPSRFPPGACAQTLVGQCGVFIHRPGEGDRFDLLVDRTLAAHFGAWLADARADFAS